MKISTIIPAVNEAAHVTACLPRDEVWDGEVILADGGSSDRTVQIAIRQGWKVCRSGPGRARQMNAGAALASGEVLLFLHADTQLPPGFSVHVQEALSPREVVAGAFRLQIECSAHSRGLRAVEQLANWRSRYLQMPYGDQGIFLSRDLFDSIGGFSDLPIMEDVDLIRRLRKRGRIAVADVPILTSGRRWEKLGLLKTTLINQACMAAYYCGVSPVSISHWYYGQ